MIMTLTVWVSTNKLRSLPLSRIGYMKCHCILANVSESIFVEFCVSDVMNIEWDYNYYQPWSDNEWLVDEMLVILDGNIII